MAVASNDRQTIGGEVKIDAVHHGAQLVLCCSEERACEVVGEHGHVHGQRGSVVAQALGLGKLLCVLRNKLVHTVLVGDGKGQRVFFDIKGERLLRKLLHGVNYGCLGKCERSGTLACVEGEHNCHNILFVACCERELTVAYLKQDAVEDRKRILAVDNF